MDPYAVLGIPRGATEEVAKNAYRRLAKTCHPDLHPNNTIAVERFKEINAAYDAIRNPQPEPTFHQFRFDDFPFGNGSPFDDLFANLRGQTRQRNNDIHMECRLSLEEAFHGKELDITLPADGRTIKVRVPPGIEDGRSIHIAQAGDHSNKGLRPGDLYLLIRVLPHTSLTRIGRNLVTMVPVTAFDVLLGHEIEVTGIDGKQMRITIPTGFDTSRKMRLSGQGMHDSAGRGDLLIELFVTFPPLTDEQRTLISQVVESSKRDDRPEQS